MSRLISVPPVIRRMAVYRAARRLYRAVQPESIWDKNARYDRETVEVMRRTLRPGTIGVDVGAHAGVFLRQMFELAPGAGHIAVEPLPHLAEQLRQAFPQARVVEAALNDHAGRAAFHYLVKSPGESGLRRIKGHGDDSVIQMLMVDVARLDDLVGEEKVIAFIKIDTEGAELPVIRGAQATIRRCRPVVVFETGLRSTPYYEVSPEDISETIHSLGMQLSTMRRWLSGVGRIRAGIFVVSTTAKRTFTSSPTRAEGCEATSCSQHGGDPAASRPSR
jgi:FkbM family methyltransferase